jgi:hypothetical protein
VTEQPFEVPRIASASPVEIVRDYLDKNRPVVLTEAIADWPALKKWSFAYLKQVAGDIQVPVRGSRYAFRLLGHVEVGAYVDWLNGAKGEGTVLSSIAPRSTTGAYVAHVRAFEQVLGADIDFSGLLPETFKINRPAFWVGPKGAGTPLHCDVVGVNLFAQIVGRKQFVLFPSDQTSLLYPSKYFEYTTSYSKVNLDAPALARFPRFARARPTRVTLNPGELLVLPRKAWHDVSSLDNSISVNATAGTSVDYNPLSFTLLRERAKRTLHWLGLYAVRKCTCHAVPTDEDLRATMNLESSALAPPTWVKYSPGLERLARRMSRRQLHNNELGRILGWYP